MKKIAELQQEILETTMKIQKEYPELSKYLREMASNNSVTSHQRITALDLKNYHESLLAMVTEYSKTHEARHAKDAAANLKFSGYPTYPASEDIFNQGTTHLDIVSSRPEQSRRSGSAMNEKDFEEDRSGEDLDIPGADLDDAEEQIGSEDEENNLYSLGGDYHDDLEEDRG